jgi:hypothetical protein
MRTCIVFLVFFLFLLPSADTQAKIIHVPADSSCIQCAINGALDGDTVLVARGHYYERINFLGKAILVTSNFIFDNDTTTIDSTIIDGEDSGTVVVFSSSESSRSTIEAFTITNGYGGIYCGFSSPTISNNTIADNSAYSGGGIYCNFSSPTISNNTIADNFAYSNGGGVYCTNSSPTISNNAIVGNRTWAYSDGGGIYCDNSSPTINSNTITNNRARWGGGILAWGSSPIICDNTISSNSSVGGGGGIDCRSLSSPVISNNAITDNFGAAGGISCDLSSPSINKNAIIANRAANYGGGILCWESHPTINHNIITSNSSRDRGGGICLFCFSRPVISYNNINDNSAVLYGGGIYCEGSSPIISNNIIIGNYASDLGNGGGICCFLSSPSVHYNDVWNNTDSNFYNCPPGVGDTTWGTNSNGTPCDSFYNISCCPLFCYPDTGNYYLAENSCCVGAGCDSLGNPDSTVDMGAFGVGCPPLFPPDPFSLLFPPNKAFTPRGVRFDWETATDPDPSDQVMYDLYVSTSYRFPSDSTTIDSNLVMSEYVKTLDYGAYYWKVKAKDNHEAERWSNQLRYFMVTGSHASLLGDLNSDGSINVGDVAFLINYLYTSGPVPEPLWVGDANCDGLVDIADIVCLINYLFIGGTLPCGF